MTALDWGWSVDEMAARLMIESAKAHLDLRLKPGNLQTACASCNWGKLGR
jgi:hypothetical protein